MNEIFHIVIHDKMCVLWQIFNHKTEAQFTDSNIFKIHSFPTCIAHAYILTPQVEDFVYFKNLYKNSAKCFLGYIKIIHAVHMDKNTTF
jgi:hypothetical protein